MNKGDFLSRVLLVAIVLTFFISSAAYAAVSATMNQIIYVWGDSMAVSGTVGGTTDSVYISLAIKNASGTIATITSTSSGGLKNTFLISASINDTLSPGEYNATLLSGTDSIDMRFKVFSQSLVMDSYPVKSGEGILDIATDNEINASNSGAFGGNFTELIDLSLSRKVYYGNHTIGSKTYHFALVDQTNSSTYDRLYVDDDTNFALYNDTEDDATHSDVEYQALKKSSIFTNGTFKYVVGEMERATGKKVVLWEPASGKTTYDKGDNITFIILTENATHLIDESVKIEIYNSTGQNVTAEYTEPSQGGWLNFTIDGGDLPPGTYTVKINDSLDTLSFTVESFKMFATIADTSNNPTHSFSPNSKARLIINSKNSTGSFNLTSFTATLNYPNGSTLAKIKSDFSQSSDGVYTYDYDVFSTGRYGVTVTGSDAAGNTQTGSTGFEVQSVSFEAMAINTRYIEEADSTGAMVDAFPPNSNITIVTFLVNITAGGISAKGSGGEMQGLITPQDCNSSVSILKIKDDSGNSYSAAYQAMNISDALNYLNVSQGDGGGGPSQEMLKQCMIIFTAPNNTGASYRAEIKMKYGSEELYSSVKFGVQRLYARGSTVDFKGDDFGFFAPNSTVRIKLKVTDLLTDADVFENSIISAKIIGMQRMYPSFKDVLGNVSARGTLGENVTNGTISFISPNDEGFYSMKFRFTANASDGTLETGIGDAFFMLKKYMVWGQLYGAQQGQWFVSQGKNATLEVTVMDINDAQTVFGGQKSQKTCTGCTGFEITATQIRNDQQFKVHTSEDYNISMGTIINSTNPVANLTIVPGPNMQSGWYSVDLIVTDPATNNTYFGWAGFEIRNFWVDMQRAYWGANNVSGYSFNDMGGGRGGETYGVDSSVEFVVIPRRPNSPDILSPTSVVVDSVMSSASWPPVPLTGYSATVKLKTVAVCRMMSEEIPTCDTNITEYVVNISGLPAGKQDQYMANVRVNVNGKTDVGTFWFSTSSYMVSTEYRRNSFPPLYASTENMTIAFTGTALTVGNGKGDPHNLTNVTVEDLFSQKMGRPIKMRYGQNYSTSCSGASCQTNITLSALSSGEYNIRFAVVDKNNNQKMEEVFFKVQDSVISVPSIEEAWIWDTDTASKKVENAIRRGEWSWCQDEKEANSGTYKFCSDYEINCDQSGCDQPNFNLTVPNGSYSKEIFGYIPMDNNNGEKRFGDISDKGRMCMYSNGSHLWINATINATANASVMCDLTQTTPIVMGATFRDSADGVWRFDSAGEQSLTLTGLGALYDTGVLINTTYSRSGVIKLGQIQENNLGAFYKEGGSGGRAGIDLTGDGYTNGTAYFAITDNATLGVYDTFFFSTDGNFSNPISVNDANRTRREFGNGTEKDRLTFLSIDPRAQRVLFYSKQIGDWAHMGDIKITNNITIPIIVAAPDGGARTALVSVTGYKNTRNWQTVRTVLVNNQNVTGVGELRLNTSNLAGAGDYSFAIETASGDKMEEWKWPMATVRGFLVDGEIGDAFYFTGFKQLPVEWKNWGNSRVIRLRQDARNATLEYIVDGVLANVDEMNPWDPQYGGGCQVFNATSNITNQVLQDSPNVYGFMKDHTSDNNGFFLYNSTSQKLYKNDTACWFNVSAATQTYQKGSSLILNRQGRNYNTTVLAIDKDVYNYNNNTMDGAYFDNTTSYVAFAPDTTPVIAVFAVVDASNATRMVPPSNYTWNSTHIWINDTQWTNATYNITYQWVGRSWRADFGVVGINSSVIMPMSNNGDSNWGIECGYMQNVSIFGTYYDVILANDTYDYQRCLYEQSGDGQCVKKAWLVPRSVGNFSSPQAFGRNISDTNFTKDLYIAGLGPYDGDGILVANFSRLSPAPWPSISISMIQLASSMTYFAALNESVLGYDLNKDGGKNSTFYILAFDSDFDGIAMPTRTIIDDDLDLLPGTVDNNGTQIQYDFRGIEGGVLNETENGLPNGIRSGNARFGSIQDNMMWENQPEWTVPYFNASDKMMFNKPKWKVNANDSVDILLKVFNFNQQPIQGANISIAQVARSSYIGFQKLFEGADYTVNKTYNVTDAKGYGLLKFTPVPLGNAWAAQGGNYQVILNIETPQGNETFERWFCVGNCGGW